MAGGPKDRKPFACLPGMSCRLVRVSHTLSPFYWQFIFFRVFSILALDFSNNQEGSCQPYPGKHCWISFQLISLELLRASAAQCSYLFKFYDQTYTALSVNLHAL